MTKKPSGTDVLVIGSILVLGIGLAWALNDPVVETTRGYVSEPADYPIDIPGCSAVEPPEQELFFGVATTGMEGYDHPDYPWLTSSKANAMSLAVQSAIPDGVEVTSGTRGPFYSEPFVFQPVPGVSEEYDAGTSASAAITRNGVAGSLNVNVTRSDEWPAPCRAGELDSREMLSDGTVVDIQDTWNEMDGVRSYSNVVRVYRGDGTRIIASSSDRDGNFEVTGAVPVTIDELRVIALRDELAWSTPVPDGFPPVPIDCVTTGFSDGQFDSGAVQRINDSLDAFWRSVGQPVVLDRPLGSVRVSQGGTATACGAVLVGDSELTVTVSEAAYSVPSATTTVTTLADGSEFRDDYSGAGIATLDGKPVEEVTLVKPSGTLVAVRVASSTDSIDRALLQGMAMAVGSVVS